jgi:hypothetical protein
MGEILVAPGKRRRSAALGWTEKKEAVRAKMTFKELPSFGRKNIDLQKSSYIRDNNGVTAN